MARTSTWNAFEGLVAALIGASVASACATQSGGLGGAALPQAPAADTGARSDGSADRGTLAASMAVTGTAPVAVPYESNDDAPSRVANPWPATLIGDGERVAEGDADVPSSAAPSGVANGSAPAADVQAGREAPIQRSALPITGTPAACKAMLKPFADAISAGKYADITMTTAMADGSYTSRSYAQGPARRVSQVTPAGQPPRFSIVVDLVQAFSDRAYDRPMTPAGSCRAPCTMTQWFDAARTDKITLQTDGNAGTTTLVLHSWGEGIVSLAPSCDVNLMWGYKDGLFYVITWRILG